MNANVDLQHVRRLLAGYVLQGTLDQRVIQPLMVPDGFVPKECEFWDYKTTANSDAVSKAETVLQAVSFYNAYGGYIIYGVAQGNNKDAYSPQGIESGVVNEQQLKALIQEYTGEAIDVSYRELQVQCGERNILFGILHIPKRNSKTFPVSFEKSGPDIKPHRPLFRGGEIYVRFQDECVPVRNKKS
jgi:predicted HTH transcriptional regulator